MKKRPGRVSLYLPVQMMEVSEEDPLVWPQTQLVDLFSCDVCVLVVELRILCYDILGNIGDGHHQIIEYSL